MTGSRSDAIVEIWGRPAGVVLAEDGILNFQFEPEYVRSGVELSPLMMPLSERVYRFSQPFEGLPGLLNDSLPDRFGTALVDAEQAAQGRLPDEFSAIDRLCYVGTRGMGALEFRPSTGPRGNKRHRIKIDEMVELAASVLRDRETFKVSLDQDQAVRDLLSIGTSAGGARAKAVIAWNEEKNMVRSGQVDAGPGFEHWLIKFDGVSDVREGDLGGPKGYGLVEYAYSLMAAEAGIDMSRCRIMEEGGRSHFMTKRFDRVENEKVHMQTLSALAHLDFNIPHHSYEQALLVGRRLGVGVEGLEQLFRRMIFNVVARNQDDHVKNIAFLMDREGSWRLSPAYDLLFAYKANGPHTSRHQMSINGKRDGFTIEDFRACAASASLRRNLAADVLADVTSAVSAWPDFASKVGVFEERAQGIQQELRLSFPRA